MTRRHFDLFNFFLLLQEELYTEVNVQFVILQWDPKKLVYLACNR